MSIIGNPLIIGDSGGGGGGGVAIIDTTDVHGGTIREIQAVESVQGTQTKTISSSGTSYVTPSSGYDAMARAAVTVPALTLPTSTSSSATSGYTSKATVSRSTSDQYINIPTGFNDEGGYYKISAVANGSAKGPTSIYASDAVVNAGTNTIQLVRSGVTTTPTVVAGYVSSATATTAIVGLTANVTTQGATTYTPTTSDQYILSDTYLTGVQTIKGDANLVAGNIKSGTTIFNITGTYGGGGGMGTLLGTLSVGTVSTTSTSASDTGKSITVKGIYDYDLLICECSVDTKTNGRHACTSRLCWLTAGTAIGTKDGATFATATWNVKLSSSGTATSRSSTTAYGVYANAATVSAGSTGDNGQAVITIYRRYNNSQTGTINGTYTMRVYGVNLYNLIGG